MLIAMLRKTANIEIAKTLNETIFDAPILLVDIIKLESILNQNLNRNKINGTVFLYDQRISVLEETYNDLNRKQNAFRENYSIKINSYKVKCESINLKINIEMVKIFCERFERFNDKSNSINVNFQTLHPLKPSSTKYTKNIRYNAIDCRAGLLASIANNDVNFCYIFSYERASVESVDLKDKFVSVNPIFSIKFQLNVAWIEFNCNGSILLVALVTDDGRLATVGLFRVERSLLESGESNFCEYKPNTESQLVDLRWHSNEKESSLMLLNDTVSLCCVKENKIDIINQKSNAFYVSWSPKASLWTQMLPSFGQCGNRHIDKNKINRFNCELSEADRELRDAEPRIHHDTNGQPIVINPSLEVKILNVTPRPDVRSPSPACRGHKIAAPALAPSHYFVN